LPLLAPRLLVLVRQAVEISRRALTIVDPLAQQSGAIDQIDGEPITLVFIGEGAAEILVRF